MLHSNRLTQKPARVMDTNNKKLKSRAKPSKERRKTPIATKTV